MIAVALASVATIASILIGYSIGRAGVETWKSTSEFWQKMFEEQCRVTNQIIADLEDDEDEDEGEREADA